MISSGANLFIIQKRMCGVSFSQTYLCEKDLRYCRRTSLLNTKILNSFAESITKLQHQKLISSDLVKLDLTPRTVRVRDRIERISQ